MRIAVLSLHTSPAAQPGRGDAGGLNVYAMATARTLAAYGHSVDIFTADPTSDVPVGQAVSLEPGIMLHRLATEAQDKEALGRDIPQLAGQLAAHPLFAQTDLIWAHYWISAAAGQLARTQLAASADPGAGAVGIPPLTAQFSKPAGDEVDPAAIVPLPESPSPQSPPLVVSFHTIAAVKNRDTHAESEPSHRLQAESRIAACADVVVANTSVESDDIEHLLSPTSRVVVAPPGIDHSVFSPGPMQAARHAAGLADRDLVVLYVGRMQYVKGTDVVIDALGALRRRDPSLAARTTLAMLGAGSGGPGTATFTQLAQAAGVADRLLLQPPVPATTLVDWYRAADVVIVPSRSESFGFVAAEAAASGAPVLAAAVGGLQRVVADGVSGRLVAGHDPSEWAAQLETLLRDPALRARLAQAGPDHAARCQWSTCVDTVLEAVRDCSQTVAAV